MRKKRAAKKAIVPENDVNEPFQTSVSEPPSLEPLRAGSFYINDNAALVDSLHHRTSTLESAVKSNPDYATWNPDKRRAFRQQVMAEYDRQRNQ